MLKKNEICNMREGMTGIDFYAPNLNYIRNSYYHVYRLLAPLKCTKLWSFTTAEFSALKILYQVKYKILPMKCRNVHVETMGGICLSVPAVKCSPVTIALMTIKLTNSTTRPSSCWYLVFTIIYRLVRCIGL